MFYVSIFLFQIGSAKTDEELRSLLADEENSCFVFETGYRMALPCLKLGEKPNLCRVLRDYHTLIKVLPEIDQFATGLHSSVLEHIRKIHNNCIPLSILL